MTLTPNHRQILSGAIAFLLLCVLAPFAIDPGVVTPITLQSLLIIGLPMIVGPVAGGAAVAAYLLAGALGLPVFAGHASGIDVFTGPSAGFLIGFLPVAVLAGRWIDRERPSYLRYAGLFFGAHVVLLIFGAVGLLVAGLGLDQVAAIMLRLLPGLVIKSLIGAGIVWAWFSHGKDLPLSD